MAIGPRENYAHTKLAPSEDAADLIASSNEIASNNPYKTFPTRTESADNEEKLLGVLHGVDLLGQFNSSWFWWVMLAQNHHTKSFIDVRRAGPYSLLS